MHFLSDLLSDARVLGDDRRSELTKWVLRLGFLAVAVILLMTAGTAGRTVAAEHPLWEAVVQARLVLVRLILSVPVVIIGFGTAVLLFNVLENTVLGQRTVVPVDEDNVDVKTMKRSNAGTVMAFLLLGCIGGLLQAVLR